MKPPVQMRPTAFLFKAGRKARLSPDAPSEFLYGYAGLRETGCFAEMFEEEELGIMPTWPWFAEAAAGRLSTMTGPHARVLSQLDRAIRGPLSPFEVLICTTNTLGIAASALRQWGRHDKQVVTMTMGLIEPQSMRWKQWLISRLFAGTTLAVLSRAESGWLRTRLDPGVNIIDFSFGVDLSFWSPGKEAPRDSVISVGNDWNRDFDTLVEAWREDFPPLTIITSLPVKTGKSNVTVERGDWRSRVISDVDLRERVRQARLVVVPLRDTIQPSGQSAALQAMACARPVVLSANRGLWDRAQIERHGACELVPPGDAAALSAAVAGLLASPDRAEAMGRRARRMLEIEDVTSTAMTRQIVAISSRAA